MEITTLIFDRFCQHLGDLVTRDGVMVQFHLSSAGEERLGTEIEEWQTRGILALHDMVKETKDGTAFVLVEDRILPRANGFLTAFRHWALEHELRIITVEPSLISCWEKMVRLPFSPTERYAMLSAVCQLPPTEVSGWMAALDDAQRAVEKTS